MVWWLGGGAGLLFQTLEGPNQFTAPGTSQICGKQAEASADRIWPLGISRLTNRTSESELSAWTRRLCCTYAQTHVRNPPDGPQWALRFYGFSRELLPFTGGILKNCAGFSNIGGQQESRAQASTQITPQPEVAPSFWQNILRGHLKYHIKSLNITLKSH